MLSLKVTPRHLNNTGCCYEYTIVSVPRIARRYTIASAARHTHSHAQCTLSWSGREEVGKVGGREQGEGGKEGRNKGWDVEREGGEGMEVGREGGMILGRARASVEEGRIDEGNERGRDGTRHVRREGKKEEEASVGGIERGMDGRNKGAGEKGGKLQGRYVNEGTGQYTDYSQTIPQRGPCP